MKELALQVATDPDQKFDLAIQLDDLDMALELARSSSEGGAEPKWRIVGDKALAAWRMDLAQECYEKAGDLSALLLIYSSLGDRDGMQKLANLARKSCWLTNTRYSCSLFHSGEGTEQRCIQLFLPDRRRCLVYRCSDQDGPCS
jgi:coatomer subunit beta'